MRQSLVKFTNSVRAKLDRFKSKRSKALSEPPASQETEVAGVRAEAVAAPPASKVAAPPPPPDLASILDSDLHAGMRFSPHPKPVGKPEVKAGPRPTGIPDMPPAQSSAPPPDHPKRLRADVAIVVVAVGALVASLIFFFGDGFFSNGSHGDLQAVGRITNSHNDVRRKVDGGLSWGAVASADKVYEGDSVFTGDHSDAVIELDKGGRIAVDPKSLIVVRTKGSNLEVDLQYGSLEGHVENNQPILLKQGNEVKKIESQNAQVRIVRTDKSRKTTIQVVSGEVKVQNKVVVKNEVAELEKDEAPVIKEVKLSLLIPAADKTLWVAPGKTVDFSWKTDKPDAQYTIEFSQTTSFEHPLHTASVQGTTYQLPESSRPTGRFYWRVRPPEDGIPSLPARLSIYPDVAPQLTTPTDQYVFTIPHESPTIEVPLAWEDSAASTSFNVQVATDDDFKTIVLDEKTPGKKLKTKALPQGHYHWRVMGLNAERKDSPWSIGASFSITPAALPLGVPVLTKSDLKYVIPDARLKGLIGPIPEEQGVRASDVPAVQWAAIPDATEYEIEQASNPQFKDATAHSSQEPSFAPAEVRPGSYYLRVRAKDQNGRLSEVSAAAHLEVSVQPPRLAKVKEKAMTFTSNDAMNNDHTKQEFNLNWTPQPFAESYELQWGADREFTRSKIFKVKENQKSVAVTHSMPYMARVRAIDKAGNPISDYSEIIVADYKKVVVLPKALPPKRQVANVSPKPPPVLQAVVAQPKPVPTASPKVAGLAMPRISAPILREPQPQSSLISLESSPTFVDFKWKPSKGATYYILEIAQDADFQNKIAQIKVQGSSFVFQKPLPEGHVFWRVRSQKGQLESEWSDVADLNVIYQ